MNHLTRPKLVRMEVMPHEHGYTIYNGDKLKHLQKMIHGTDRTAHSSSHHARSAPTGGMIGFMTKLVGMFLI